MSDDYESGDDTESVQSFHSCLLLSSEENNNEVEFVSNVTQETDEEEWAKLAAVPSVVISNNKALVIPQISADVRISPPLHHQTETMTKKKNRRIITDDDDDNNKADARPVAEVIVIDDENTDENDDAFSSHEQEPTGAKKSYIFDEENSHVCPPPTPHRVQQPAQLPKRTFEKDPASGDWKLAGEAATTRLPKEIGDFLYDYQLEGVEFLLRSWESECSGAILADDMGMGKTNQAVAAVSALLYSHHASRILVIAPLSVMDRWKSLLTSWAQPHMRGQVLVFHGPRKDSALKQIEGHRGGILLTTYETCQSNVQALKRVRWDCLVADEATKIKNSKTALFKALRELSSCAKRRACLTGTPVENSLAELWALFDFACDGKLLGTHSAFNRHFAGRIERSQLAGNADVMVGTQLSRALHAVIAPFLLRREKTMFFKKQEGPTAVHSSVTTVRIPDENSVDEMTPNASIIIQDPTAKLLRLPEFNVRKVDVLVWIHLSQKQRDLYKSFLESEEVALALNKTQSPLAALTVLKKICDDPRLVGGDMQSLGIRDSGKLQVLVTLLRELALEGGHKTIVFSHSKRMIDFMEKALNNNASSSSALAYLRVDGDQKVTERIQAIKAFNRDEPVGDGDDNDGRNRDFDGRWDVLFLTSGVGALGIEVTGADRVIIFDPHWNPAVDDQAIDRAFRIGQKKNVVCYRFVTVGTVEEKMTRIQVRKTSLARKVLMAESQRSYSTLIELKDLFTLGEPDSEDRLFRVLERCSNQPIEMSVRAIIAQSQTTSKSDLEEVLSQIAALGGKRQDDDDSELGKLFKEKVIAGVSDRAALFSSEDSELEETMKAMSMDDKKAVSKVVEDAMGWLMTKS